MKKQERLELETIHTDLRLASDALTQSPLDRGKALGRIFDSIESIESMLAEKKDSNGD